MRKGFHRSGLLIVLVMILLMSCVIPASAQEPAEYAKKEYTIDTESAAYIACDEAAAKMAATQVLVYDATADQILYAKTVEGGKLYPASITKLFSIYVALQHLDPKEVITAGDELELVQPGSSVAYIGKGNQLRAEMVVEGMLLPSGNDAAMVLAAAAGRKIAGDQSLKGEEAVQVFVDEMNRQAEMLGFVKSHFANPDGFHVGAHYTCINDMAIIAGLALSTPTISKYMGVHEEEVVYVSGHTILWENTNLLLDPESVYYHPQAIGMKTGYTSQAGYSLMSAFRSGGRTIVVGVFGYPDKESRFADVVTLFNAVK